MSRLLQVTVNGGAELRITLGRLVSEFEQEKLLDQGAAILLSRIRTRFQDKVDPEGTPWIPSQAGLLRQSKGGPGTGFDTGNLFYSLQLAARGPGERAIMTDVEYGPFFQFGTRTMVPRVFLGFGDSDVEASELFLLNRIKRILK